MKESSSRLGLCLSGGGITGAMYSVGCLAAIEDACDGFSANDFGVFIGSSSGASVAVPLAGGLGAQRIYRALLDPADDFFALQRHHLLRFDVPEWKRVLRSAVGAGRRLATSVASRPLELDVWQELERFTDSIPAGIFAMDAYERFFADFMKRRGIPSDFERFQKKLVLVASDLDEGERAVFGQGALLTVPVARAVAAASATPPLFAPVRIGRRDYIDGGIGEVANVDVAVELGCDFVLVINPMVPIRSDIDVADVPTGHGQMKRVRDKGMLWVYAQAWRMRSAPRFKRGLERFVAAHPRVDVQVLEPPRDDATLFLHSPMNFAARRTILEHAYRLTTHTLREPTSSLRRGLERRGVRFRSS